MLAYFLRLFGFSSVFGLFSFYVIATDLGITAASLFFQYKITKVLNIKNRWLIFIPLGNAYIDGYILDMYDEGIAHKNKHKFSSILLAISLFTHIISFFSGNFIALVIYISSCLTHAVFINTLTYHLNNTRQQIYTIFSFIPIVRSIIYFSTLKNLYFLRPKE